MKNKKKKIKNEVREVFPLYDIERSEARTTIVPKLQDGEEKVRFDSIEAEAYLERCIAPMIAEAKMHIKEQVNDHKFYKDFPACGLRMKEVFIDAFSFMLYVERFSKPEGKSSICLMAIETDKLPLFESKIYFAKDWRDGLVRYMEREKFHHELLSMLKQLMVCHHKELMRKRG